MINFENLNFEDYSKLKEYFKSQNYLLSEYSPVTIFIWNGCLYRVKKAFYKEYILISEISIENENKKGLMMPIGKAIPTPEELKEIIDNTEYKKYYYVPENYVNQFKDKIEKDFNIYEQSGYMDYIYLAQDLLDLKGQKYSKKRNLISQFERNFIEFTTLSKINKENIKDIKEGIEKFDEEEKQEILKDIRICEKKAIINAINNWEIFNEDIQGIIFYIDKKIAGFVIGSKLNYDTIVLNFEKGNKKIKGLYQYMDREFARGSIKNFKFINKESDLDKPGLIKAKESYHPINKIKSYILERKD